QVDLFRRNFRHARLTELSLGEAYGERRHVTRLQATASDIEQPLLKGEQSYRGSEPLSCDQRAMKRRVYIAVDFPTRLIELGYQSITGTSRGGDPELAFAGDLDLLGDRRHDI